MPSEPDTIDALTRACDALPEAGQPREAGLLAAEGWVAVRGVHPRQAQHLDGVMHLAARLDQHVGQLNQRNRKEAAMPEPDRILDVRTERPERRHELIFEAFNDLEPGTAYVLVNDHDPKPLRHQFEAELPGEFSWEYLEEGPEVWWVRIVRTGTTRPAIA